MKHRFLYKLSETSNTHISDDTVQIDMFNAEIIGLSIAKIKHGKAPGFDRLQVEHLVNAHPIVYSILSKMFYLMLRYSYVPACVWTWIAYTYSKRIS